MRKQTQERISTNFANAGIGWMLFRAFNCTGGFFLLFQSYYESYNLSTIFLVFHASFSFPFPMATGTIPHNLLFPPSYSVHIILYPLIQSPQNAIRHSPIRFSEMISLVQNKCSENPLMTIVLIKHFCPFLHRRQIWVFGICLPVAK